MQAALLSQQLSLRDCHIPVKHVLVRVCDHCLHLLGVFDVIASWVKPPRGTELRAINSALSPYAVVLEVSAVTHILGCVRALPMSLPQANLSLVSTHFRFIGVLVNYAAPVELVALPGTLIDADDSVF